MSTTIEQIQSDILSSAGPAGPVIVGRIRDLWRELNSENTTLLEEALKASMLERLMKTEIARLKRQIAKLQKMKFGASADQNPSKNNSTDITESETDTGDKNDGQVPIQGSDSRPPINELPRRQARPRNTAGRGKRVWPDHLERRELYMGTKDRKCPCGCRGSIISMDTNETLEVIPARYYVAVRNYPKYRCRRVDTITGTTFKPRIFPKTAMSNCLIANSIMMRFGWQLPWYRQEGIFKSQGIELSRTTLMRWSNRVAVEALLPIYELMEAELKTNSSRLFMDETPLPMLVPGKGHTQMRYLYALLRDDRSFGGNKPPMVIYYACNSRAMYHIHDILGGVKAILQTDAYSGYGRLGRAGTPVEFIKPAKCWAHGRRNFTDEYQFNSTLDADEIIQIIAELYHEERKIYGKPPSVRVAHRRQFSQPILDRLRQLLTDISVFHLPKSKMSQAIRYLLKLWDQLTLFVDDGRIDLDTNAVERMFKPVILLRKNVMFIGSDEGFQAWGIHASIIETCKLNGVNPEPYLKWVLDEIAGKLPRAEYEKLLPWNAPVRFRISS